MADKKVKTIGTEDEIDFSGIKPFEPIDPSVKYKALVTVCKKGVSGSGGATYPVEFTITAPDVVDGVVGATTEKTGNKVNAKNRKIFKSYSKSPKALGFLYEFINACKPGTPLGAGFKMIPEDYVGCEVVLTITNKESNKGDGKFFPELKRVQSIAAWK
jgi:hypothetical protein